MENVNKTVCFPFDFVPMNNGKCSFLKNVEEILKTDLQSRDSFGCTIRGCHTHAGSKVHFHNFIEAEILFHNNYYNHGFAYLTVEEILLHIEKNNHQYKHVYLIGYEGYSELYLREVKRQFEQAAKSGNTISCDYFIYETLSADESSGKKPSPSIRNLYNNERGNLSCCYSLPKKEFGTELPFQTDLDKCLFVYIVPINTTLSTMDKMISLFEKRCWSNDPQKSGERLYLCLITIGPQADKQADNIYWTLKAPAGQKTGEILRPQKDRFINLKEDDSVKSFAFTESTWTYARINNSIKSICEDCYPDKVLKSLKDEKPIFDVTRGSVVPMLQLSQNAQLKPIPDDISYDKITTNLNRVWEISKYSSYHHICRGNNHFQYYIDAPGFLNNYGKPEGSKAAGETSVIKYLADIRAKSDNKKVQKVIYNYIVAPSHRTNAAWVNLVYTNIFANDGAEFKKEFNGARVLYFDISKEYRSNFKAKYSDFFQSFSNIIRYNEEYEIRFHYVDETISSGSRLLRAADLVQSLLSSIHLEEEQKKKIKLFHSIFLLYGRSSGDTKRFYYRLFKQTGASDIDRLLNDNFHEYVGIRISQMRNFKDACVLCKMTNDYRLIQRYCATNTLADRCGYVIGKHKARKATYLAERNEFFCELEKRLVFLISHILNSRLSSNNLPLFYAEAYKCQIDVDSESAEEHIHAVLTDYFHNLTVWLCDLIPDFRDTLDPDSFKRAFIKVISRPFFTFYLRKRQAAFSFCLEQLDNRINEATPYNRYVQTLVNALADMNANYLIRQKPFLWLQKNAGESKESAVHFCHAIKKMLTLSQDTTKSLLLEHILVNNDESGFFADKPAVKPSMNTSRFICEESGTLKIQGIMFIENNRILNDALSDIKNNPALTKDVVRMPYFLDNFKSMLEINQSELEKDFGSEYEKLVKRITNDKVLPFSDLHRTINSIKPINRGMSCPDFKIMPFVRILEISSDKKNFNKLFEFIHFTEGEELQDRKRFYHDKNFRMLHSLFQEKIDDPDLDLLSEDVLFCPDGIVLLRFNKNNSISGNNAAAKTDNAIYMQICNFNTSCPVHWFRLKVLLSLRAIIVKMIDSINMPEVIERKLNELLQAAIADKKSQMHNSIETALILSFWQGQPGEYGIKKIIDKMDGSYPKAENKEVDALSNAVARLFCRYYSLLADELLASWYRKLIRREKPDGIFRSDPEMNALPTQTSLCQQPFFNTNSCESSVESFMTNLFNAKFGKQLQIQEGSLCHVGSFDYYLSNRAADFSKVKVTIQVKRSNDSKTCAENFEVLSLAVGGARISRSTLYPIIALLINNAAVHGNINEVFIIFDVPGKCIHIENQVEARKTTEEKEKLEECLSVLPFIRNDGQTKNGGITIWTLKHLVRNRNWFHAVYDTNRNRFVVTISDSIEQYDNNFL